MEQNKEVTKKIEIVEGGVYGAALTIRYLENGDIKRGISIRPTNIKRLPSQIAVYAHDMILEYFLGSRVRIISTNEIKLAKEEIRVKHILKLWKLEIRWG